MWKLLCAAFLVFSLTACGGRVAKPVSIRNSFDTQLTCSHLFGERDNVSKRLAELTGESRDKVANNIGMLVLSPFFLDLSQTQKEEASAIADRTARIDELLADKECDAQS